MISGRSRSIPSSKACSTQPLGFMEQKNNELTQRQQKQHQNHQRNSGFDELTTKESGEESGNTTSLIEKSRKSILRERTSFEFLLMKNSPAVEVLSFMGTTFLTSLLQSLLIFSSLLLSLCLLTSYSWYRRNSFWSK